MLKNIALQDFKTVPKPRQTRSDVWKQRPCVMNYRAFADELRLRFGKVPEGVEHIDLSIFIKMPETWSQKKKNEHKGRLHRQKPDIDNLLKAVMDALFINDAGIARIAAVKIWAPYDKIEISLY